jgi:hypothetical protein
MNYFLQALPIMLLIIRRPFIVCDRQIQRKKVSASKDTANYCLLHPYCRGKNKDACIFTSTMTFFLLFVETGCVLLLF